MTCALTTSYALPLVVVPFGMIVRKQRDDAEIVKELQRLGYESPGIGRPSSATIGIGRPR